MKVLYTLLFSLFLCFKSIGSADSLSLYIFLLDDCPICLQYTPTLNELYDSYGDQINFVGYFPNFSSKPSKIETFKTTYHIKFPLFTDYYKTKAKKFNAKITPEVVLYNHTTEKIMYQGRIDNKFYSLGRRRNVITEHNLEDAIESVLNNIPVEIDYSEPVGCYINYSDNFTPKTKGDQE